MERLRIFVILGKNAIIYIFRVRIIDYDILSIASSLQLLDISRRREEECDIGRESEGKGVRGWGGESQKETETETVRQRSPMCGTYPHEQYEYQRLSRDNNILSQNGMLYWCESFSEYGELQCSYVSDVCVWGGGRKKGVFVDYILSD